MSMNSDHWDSTLFFLLYFLVPTLPSLYHCFCRPLPTASPTPTPEAGRRAGHRVFFHMNALASINFIQSLTFWCQRPWHCGSGSLNTALFAFLPTVLYNWSGTAPHPPPPPPITLTHHAAHIWYVSKSVQGLKFLIQFLEQLHVSFPGVHDFLQWQGSGGEWVEVQSSW